MIILNPMLDFLKESAKEGNEKRLKELKESLELCYSERSFEWGIEATIGGVSEKFISRACLKECVNQRIIIEDSRH